MKFIICSSIFIILQIKITIGGTGDILGCAKTRCLRISYPFSFRHPGPPRAQIFIQRLLLIFIKWPNIDFLDEFFDFGRFWKWHGQFIIFIVFLDRILVLYSFNFQKLGVRFRILYFWCIWVYICVEEVLDVHILQILVHAQNPRNCSLAWRHFQFVRLWILYYYSGRFSLIRLRWDAQKRFRIYGTRPYHFVNNRYILAHFSVIHRSLTTIELPVWPLRWWKMGSRISGHIVIFTDGVFIQIIIYEIRLFPIEFDCIWRLQNRLTGRRQ